MVKNSHWKPSIEGYPHDLLESPKSSSPRIIVTAICSAARPEITSRGDTGEDHTPRPYVAADQQEKSWVFFTINIWGLTMEFMVGRMGMN